MTILVRIAAWSFLSFFGLSLVLACAFDNTLREYLSLQFWLPMATRAVHTGTVERSSTPFAGMEKAQSDSPLAKLQAAYQTIPADDFVPTEAAELQRTLAAARSQKNLTSRERDQVRLIDAKIDLRAGSVENAGPLLSAKKKLTEFPKVAETSEYLSEARGWLARVYFLLGEHTAAGKIYLDELNRTGSNLSTETLATSLKMNYGYDGGLELVAHLDEYFDTAEHAAFAIQLVTNPRWDWSFRYHQGEPDPIVASSPPYGLIQSLLEKHRDLFRSKEGAGALALLGMRTALRAGDPAGATRIAAKIPTNAAFRGDPDFLWMSASAHFLSRDYDGAKRPLLRLFRSPRSSDDEKAAAAYALCGVYRKTGNSVEQIRFALWLRTEARRDVRYISSPGIIEDRSIYWATSGWDLNLLLDAEAPIAALRTFLERHSRMPDVRLVRYGLAVRLARANQYEEAARIYAALNARVRASRMREVAALYKRAHAADLPLNEHQEATYNFARFISAHPDGVYFNDELWGGLQRYALFGSRDGRMTRAEHLKQIAFERKLKDEQEERWRAYLLLREVVAQAGKADLGRKAAVLAIRCLRGISSERFERANEIRAADIQLSRWLRS